MPCVAIWMVHTIIDTAEAALPGGRQYHAGEDSKFLNATQGEKRGNE